jgi:hypothetical protein
MSTYIKATQHAADSSARTKFKVDKGAETNQPTVEAIDVTALEIDNSYDTDCDPYNSTGQFLVQALKKNYND